MSSRRVHLALRAAAGAIALLALIAGISALVRSGNRTATRDRLTASERKVPVVVFNDSGAPGLALKAVHRLSQAGFEHGALGSASVPTPAQPLDSTVQYAPGGSSAAQDAARVLGIDGAPVSNPQTARPGYRIAVILGRESVHLD